MAKRMDWESHIGERWGRLTIVRPVDVGRGRTGYECRCDCGGVKTVKVYQHLTSGKVKSCGCMGREKHDGMVRREQERRDRYEAMQAEWARRREEREAAESARREEREAEQAEYRRFVQDNIRLYYCWQSMIQRCTRQTHHKYHLYGSRGIKVCDEWRSDFRVFAEWSLSNGYAEGMTIDRIDDNGHYEPSNCRWVTNMENCNNKRTNTYLMDDSGVVHTRAEWIRLGFSARKVDGMARTGDLLRVGYDEAIKSRK